jgi:hypothetical protein
MVSCKRRSINAVARLLGVTPPLELRISLTALVLSEEKPKSVSKLGELAGALGPIVGGSVSKEFLSNLGALESSSSGME